MNIHKFKGEKSRSWSVDFRASKNNNAQSWAQNRECGSAFNSAKANGSVQHGDHFFYLHTAWSLDLPTHFLSFFYTDQSKEDDHEYDDFYWNFDY